jgi:hypothetical protein
LIKILEGNFWKEILWKNSGKKEISGYGEGNYYFWSGNTGAKISRSLNKPWLK